MAFDLTTRCDEVMANLKTAPNLRQYVVFDPIPQPFCGNGPIQLIVIGQDPTIRNAAKRKEVTTVLNLNKKGSATGYLSLICKALGLDLKQHVYATNVYKNFFIEPPTSIKKIDIFGEFLDYWRAVLIDEVQQFPNVPIITLGEPILRQVVNPGVNARLRTYWGYQPGWQEQSVLPTHLGHVTAAETWLQTPIFPFPHIPSLRKPFYRQHLAHYSTYMQQVAFGRA